MTTNQTWQEGDLKGAFFPVELRPLFMRLSDGSNDYRQLKRHFVVVDTEREHSFAVVTDDYELVTNETAYSMAAGVMSKVFNATQISDLKCLKITMPKTRSFCHIDLIHKSADFSPWEKDKWTAFLRISNSYNRTRRLRFELGFCRWICLNGMIFGAKSIEFSYAHTRRGMDKVSRFADNIGDLRKLETRLTDKLHQLDKYPFSREEMLPLFCRVFEIKARKEDLEKQRRVESLLAIKEAVESLTTTYFSDIGPNGYAALNVLTDYASRPAGVMSPQASMHGLQQRAGRWVDQFLAAAREPTFSLGDYLADYQETAALINSIEHA